MKLKKPINLTIETDEQAMLLWHWLNIGNVHRRVIKDRIMSNIGGFAALVEHNAVDGEGWLWNQLDEKIRSAGIDVNYWEPSKPIKIADKEVEFTDTGIKVGCTEVSKETILEIAKRFQ